MREQQLSIPPSIKKGRLEGSGIPVAQLSIVERSDETDLETDRSELNLETRKPEKGLNQENRNAGREQR